MMILPVWDVAWIVVGVCILIILGSIYGKMPKSLTKAGRREARAKKARRKLTRKR